MKIINLLRSNWLFMVPYLGLLLGLGVEQILYRQGIITLEVNRYSSTEADLFFTYFTHLGDGVFCIFLGLLLLFWSKAKGILLLVSYTISGVLAQLIKNFGFPKEPRPAEYFAGMMDSLHTVSGVTLSHWNSFPSGHTTSAFAVFGLLAIWTASPLLKFSCLVVAVLVGFSRMYLLQHFLIDVYAGSLLGVLTAYSVVLFQKEKKR
ncbi:MAG: phosphatase PAP2 family protein [Spirosomataceae bacterium]